MMKRLQIAFEKYYAIFVMQYRTKAAYFSTLLSETPIIALRLWILSQFYNATYQTYGLNDYKGLTIPALIWSIMFIQAFEGGSFPSISSIIDEEIKSGSIAYTINRPYSYILYQYVGYLGRTIPSLLVNVTGGAIAAWILVGPLPATWWTILLGVFLMYVGYTLNFLIEISIGLLGFWIEDTESVAWLYQKAVLLLGGYFLPLTMFPDIAQVIAQWLPFGALYYGPAQLIVNFNLQTLYHFLAVQSIWLIISGIIAYFIFNRGMKHVSVQGG